MTARYGDRRPVDRPPVASLKTSDCGAAADREDRGRVRGAQDLGEARPLGAGPSDSPYRGDPETRATCPDPRRGVGNVKDMATDGLGRERDDELSRSSSPSTWSSSNTA